MGGGGRGRCRALGLLAVRLLVLRFVLYSMKPLNPKPKLSSSLN